MKIQIRTSRSAKQLLDAYGSPMDSATLIRAFQLAGLVEERTYLSSTGSGEIKRYWAFAEPGFEYGINQATLSPTKTELRFFEETFTDALLIAAELILQHTKGLVSSRS